MNHMASTGEDVGLIRNPRRYLLVRRGVVCDIGYVSLRVPAVVR
jgi:hypothetical protein